MVILRLPCFLIHRHLYHYQNVVSLPLSGEVETGSAGEQPIRNDPAEWNGQGGQKSPSNFLLIPRNYVLENPKIQP